MNHGFVDILAFQEALLIEAAFGIALLAMIWIGFRRWLRHKEEMSRLLAERAAQHHEDIERVEARLQVIEQALTHEGLQMAAIPKPGEVQHNP